MWECDLLNLQGSLRLRGWPLQRGDVKVDPGSTFSASLAKRTTYIKMYSVGIWCEESGELQGPLRMSVSSGVGKLTKVPIVLEMKTRFLATDILTHISVSDRDPQIVVCGCI